ncbi:MAG: TfoX/Sxy family protein [Sphingomonadales bacterium]|nr:TfoX/Sxy family protein [Sphingomonadales bacterium]
MMADDGLLDWLGEELTALGSLSCRRMMGGRTLYLDGTVFAILDEGELWLKADAASDAAWDAAGCPRFTYEMGEGRTGSMNYRRAPSEVYDDGDALRHWAALALEAGRRAPVKKTRRK